MDGVGNGERATKELCMEVEMSSHLQADSERDNDRAEIREKRRWRERTGYGTRDVEMGANESYSSK